jgi:hypothetical protein
MKIPDVARFRVPAFVTALSWMLLTGAAPLHAETQFGIAVFGGYNSYGMEDVNDFIDFANDSLLGGSGYALDEISSGFSYGAGVRIRPSGDKLMVALDYEHLMADTDLEVGTASVELGVPANAFTGTLFYFFPSSSRARFGLGAGVGYYSSSGSLEAEDGGVGFEIDIEGSSIGFHGLAALDVAISPVVHFEGAAGYRLAETTELEIGDEEVPNSDGDDASIDWSGLMSRLGLTFYFGSGGSSSP